MKKKHKKYYSLMKKTLRKYGDNIFVELAVVGRRKKYSRSSKEERFSV